MPWRELSVKEQREEFVKLALQAGANKSELCRRFGISREKGYKWLRRYRAEGCNGLADRSRRPRTSPGRTAAAIEQEVLRIRDANNDAWGGRKIAWRMAENGWRDVPAPSTITAILRRHGKLEAGRHEHPGPLQRFERSAPNELWQIDFKGHFPLLAGRCHPLTVLDDHSRYAVGLEACADEQDLTVRERLSRIFRRHGLPNEMLMDNGPPWGDRGGQPFTAFTVWLMRRGIGVLHGRPYHPQTQGKDERFHRTLAAEVLFGRHFGDIPACQGAFDRWRHIYNHERPHEALGLQPPARRYRISARPFVEALPPIEYRPGDQVRRVDDNGVLQFKGRRLRVGKAFRGQDVALRQGSEDGVLSVHFCHQHIGSLDLRRAPPTCGMVDILDTMPTNPQAQPHRQPARLTP